jgi:uncharacterized protein with GYD domain
MATYVVLISRTDQGTGNARDPVARAKQVRDLATSLGGIIESIHWCLGRYDIVVIADFPDNAASDAFAAQVTSEGNVTIETFPAFSADEGAAFFI